MTDEGPTADTRIPAQILMVEDDDGEAKAIRRAFKKERIFNSIFRAIDGVEALEMLRQADSPIDFDAPIILLVDLNMPRMNGHEFLAELRRDRNLAHLVAFILTTSSDREDIEASYGLNVAGYIVKSRAGEDFRMLMTLLDDYWFTVALPTQANAGARPPEATRPA